MCSAKRENPCFFGKSPCFCPKKQGLEGQGRKKKQAFLSPLRSVLLPPYRNSLSVVFLVREGPLGSGFEQEPILGKRTRRNLSVPQKLAIAEKSLRCALKSQSRVCRRKIAEKSPESRGEIAAFFLGGGGRRINIAAFPHSKLATFAGRQGRNTFPLLGRGTASVPFSANNFHPP